MSMADVSHFVSALKTDPPFSYPHPNARTKALLVETSSIKLFKQELGIRYRNFMRNSGITDIMGRARSGKTHLIWNLEYRTNVKGEYKGLVVILPLFGQDISPEYVLEHIIRSEPFRRKASEFGIDIDSYRQDKAEPIKLLIKKLRDKYGPEVGILFAVDDVDEHIRQRRPRVPNLQQDLEQFLGVFRLLIGTIDEGLCVVLILTENAFDDIEGALADPTLAGRIEIIYNPNDPGRELRLSELSEDEAILMVSRYMEHWANRNGINLPESGKCMVDGRNIFPFMLDAVKLFRDAGSWAGLVCKGCKDALSRKEDTKTEEELIVTEEDAALVISASVKMYPNFPALKSRISSLIGGPKIESEIKSWIDGVAKIKFSGDIYKGGFKTALRNYLEVIGKENEEKMEFEPNVTVIDPYTNKHYELDIRLGLDDMRIGVTFTQTPVVGLKSGEALSVALRNQRITHGIFIYAGKEPELDFKGEREQGLDTKLHKELRDYVSGTDFNSVVSILPIDEFDAWGIIRGREITDPNMKIRVLGWIEGRLQVLDKLKKLISAEPRRISPPRRFRPGDLLGRGEP
ncbi:hypothetical protein ES703_08131 [subsurface metagenome]